MGLVWFHDGSSHENHETTSSKDFMKSSSIDLTVARYFSRLTSEHTLAWIVVGYCWLFVNGHP